MNFNDYLDKSKKEIQSELQNIFKSWQEELNKFKNLTPLISLFIEMAGRGKMLRGALVKLGFSQEEFTDSPEINKVAAAYEIFHASILLHDDIIDKSALRRGKKSVYQELGGNHYGISQAICLGDVGFALSLRIISSVNFPESDKDKIIKLFTKMMQDTVLGQMLDIELTLNKKKVSEDSVIELYKQKTANYSFVTPLQIGTVLSQKDAQSSSKIAEFGENLGIAYQINDDILGVFGNNSTIGKSTVSDISEGKTTLLYLKARQNADSKQNQTLNGLYGKKNISESELLMVRNIFLKTDALDYAKSKVIEYSNKAEKMIPKMSNKKIQIILKDMVKYLIDRQK